ncbi:MAG: PAS domain S-box protein [Methylobacter sp.]
MGHIKAFLSNAYVASILVTAAILAILEELQTVFEGAPPLLLFLVAIAFAAWSGGLKTALFITALSSVASAYFLVQPYYSFHIIESTREILRISLLAGVGTVCSLLIARLRKQEELALHMVMEREQQLKREIADRNRTQSDLNLYVSLVRSSTEFIGMCDTKGVPFFINDAGLRLVGLDSLEQGLKTSVKDFFFPEDQALVMETFFPEVLRNGQGEIEIRFRHFKTGEALWMIYNVFALKDLDGQTIGLGTVSTHITRRKQIEEALRDSQRDLNYAQKVAHIGSWRLNVHDNILEWSDENYRIFGAIPGTPQTYESFLEIVHPNDREQVDNAWKEALNGKPYDISHRIIADGKIKWVREQAELEFDEHGALLGGFGTTEDITRIKNAQDALQHERAFLREVIDAAPSIIFVKDSNGRFLLANKAMAQCYGTSPESLIGKTDKDFHPYADEVSNFHYDDIYVLSTRKIKQIAEEKVTQPDGSPRWYSTVKIPLFEDGTCDKLLGVATDITERKHAEEKLRLANQRKDEFLAMLAHELRTPLAPIRNAVQLLKMHQPTDNKLAWSCNVIDRQVSHMARLLDDLLDVARIMQGKIRLQMERIELTDVINNAVETSRPLIESRNQELTISKPTIPQWVDGDRVRLAQVLSNLLNNAAKYTDEGGKIMLIVTQQSSTAVIEVKDTGIGIAPDILPQIFDLFTQADHSLAHSQGGLGIGLTLVRQLVEKHGGTVAAASPGVGLGSSFTVRLPTLPKDSPASETERFESMPPQRKCRVLVVDDYTDAAESLTTLLQSEGHDVDIANCGMQALEIAAIFRPQVVLLDIGLPDLDGYEVAKRLRALPGMQNTVLIALTGFGQIEDCERSRAAGFDHHLLKPLNFEKLSELLGMIANC